MIDWTIATITFLGTIAIMVALGYAFLPDEYRVAGRLSRVLSGTVRSRESGFREKQTERIRETFASVGKLVSAKRPSSQSELTMVRAGLRSHEFMLAMNGMRLLLPICLVGIVFLSGVYRHSPILILAIAAIAGYMLPELWLMRRIRSRQHRLRLGVPDCLDLLVICVEAGLGLDQGMLRVSEELYLTHKELSEELQQVNAEIRLGKTRAEALRDLAFRTGLEDIKSLVAMLVQTERFGTSIAQSLRVHSDDLRTKRRQRAEEMAGKVSIKMIPVLIFFIFPALLAVTVGPAVITIWRQIVSMH